MEQQALLLLFIDLKGRKVNKASVNIVQDYSGEVEELQIVWKRTSGIGLEHCEIGVNPTTSLKGQVFSFIEKEPIYVQYRVNCDVQGSTKDLEVLCRFNKTEKTTLLSRSADDYWFIDGLKLKQFTGIKDIDLGATPSTNTLPIRRLNLRLGESKQFSALWLKFPEMNLEPLAQRYTRVGPYTYMYESVQSGYTAKLEVDDIGAIVSYELEWERVR